MRLVAVWLLVSFVLVGCGGAGQSSPATSDLAGRCPEVPDAWVSIDDSTVWPAAAVDDLVPEFEDICVTPTAPALFAQLNESVAMSGSVEAAGLGVLHEAGSALASFSVTRSARDVPGLDEGVGASGAKLTRVGELELAWARSGSHVAVFWLHEFDVVTIAAGSPELAADAATRWLKAMGVDVVVTAPEDIPEIAPLPPALAEGLPVDGFPSDDYTYLSVDPILFLEADVADAVTVFDEPLEAVGAAVILSKEGILLGTAVGWKGTADGVATAPRHLATEMRATPISGHVATGITAGQLDVVVVGYDDSIEDLADAWKRNFDRG